jgi:rusticyanin
MVTNTSPADLTPSGKLARGTAQRVMVIAAAAALVGVGAGVGITIAVNRGSSPSTSPGAAASTQNQSLPYGYYQSMMSGYGGSMMGGSYGWMTGQAGYQWMVGGAQAPAWMMGNALPGFMMGSSGDPGAAMGQFWAGAPGPRVDAATAQRLGAATPAGATVDAAANRITFSGQTVRFDVVASPSSADDRFEVAGLVNPTIAVPAGASVTIELINSDSGSAHGLVVATVAAQPSVMPMMTSRPAFSGSAIWFLGDATSAGMHDASTTFTASSAGTYQYLCPVPGHAQHGMYGTLLVGSGS